MRKSILNCLDREVVATEDTLVEELRKDATLLPSQWMSKRMVKTLAWLRYHPLAIRYTLHLLTKDKLVKKEGKRFILTELGRMRLGYNLAVIGEHAPRHLRAVST